jgi:hypothetical protein
LAKEIKVHDIALPVRIPSAKLRFRIAGGHAQSRAEFFRIILPDSNGCKNPCFVAAAWMLRIQTVIQQWRIRHWAISWNIHRNCTSCRQQARAWRASVNSMWARIQRRQGRQLGRAAPPFPITAMPYSS